MRGSSTAERSTVNRMVVGSNPTPAVGRDMRKSKNVFYIGDVINDFRITSYYRRGNGKEMLSLERKDGQRAQLSFSQVKHLEGWQSG